ncbi:MAG TPA: type II toxin-antitoxin system VapC family toxin [Geminicoccaceae bacterium]|nr:type II toxin-antitoxin system VapC family toxin [Geminicoccaceae bacterium]
MRLLLDTHALIWALDDPGRLPAKTRQAIDAGVVVFTSAASIWEIAIKVALRRLVFPIDELPDALTDAAFQELPISIAHSLGAAGLPLLNRDPFDRLLVAQARYERLTLVTRDPAIRRYPVDTLWD